MNLSGITGFLTEHPEFQRLLEGAQGNGTATGLKGKSLWEGVVLDPAKPSPHRNASPISE